MKKVVLGIMLSIMLIPMGVMALEEEDLESLETLNLSEALEEEEIEADLGDYTESTDKVNIYLFRGKGCSVCRSFITYLSTIVDEYGDYFNLVSYEVWYDTDNYNLLSEVADFTGIEASGVPYIVIGDEVFAGYSESYDEDIIAAITELYDSDDRYDIFESIIDGAEFTNTDSTSGLSTTQIVFIFILIVILIGIFAFAGFKYNEVVSYKGDKKE